MLSKIYIPYLIPLNDNIERFIIIILIFLSLSLNFFWMFKYTYENKTINSKCTVIFLITFSFVWAYLRSVHL